MVIFVCIGKCKIPLSVPCHSNLNAVVFGPVGVFQKIRSAAGIVFRVIGVRSLQEKERVQKERRERCGSFSLQGKRLISQFPLQPLHL